MLAMVRKQELVYAPLAVETLSGGVEMIERLTAEWRVLCAEGSSVQPFFQPEWIATYMRAFASHEQLIVYTVRRAGQLRAVLPLVVERAFLHGVPVRKLRSPSGVHSCRFDLVASPGEEEEAVQLLWQELRKKKDWDVLELFDVPQGGLGERLLSLAANEGFPTGMWDRPAGPFVLLTDDKYAGQGNAPAASTKFRSSLRRLRRKLEAQGVVQLGCEEDATPSALAQFYALERSGWKGRQGTAIDCDEGLRQFYDAIAQTAAAEGRLLLYHLECGKQTIAMQFCITYGNTCYLLKPAYDERFSAFSPGHLLTAEMLRDLVTRGLTVYDLLSPQSEWKSRWTKTVRGQSHLYIFQRGLIGRALHIWKFQVAQRARQMKRHFQSK